MLPLAFGPIDWLVVVLYLAGVMAIGALFARKRGKGDDDYFLAGRSMPGFAVTLSLLATSLSAATFVGAPNDAYAGNLTFLILYVGNFLAVLIVAFIFVPRLYAAGTTTIYGHLGQKYGPAAQRAAGATFIVGRLLASGARLFLAATPLWLILTNAQHALADGRHQLALCVIAVGTVGTLYTLLGGIRAVMWTDVIQLGLVFVAVAACVIVAYGDVALSVGEIVQRADDADKLTVLDLSTDLSRPYTLWTALLCNTLFFAAIFGTDHDLAQRFLTAKSVKSGMWSVILSQAIGLVVVGLFMAMGLLLWVFYDGNADVEGPLKGQPVFVLFIIRELPPVVAGLAVAGLFAAAQSSMDSATNAIAGSALHDVWRPDAHAKAATSAGPSRVTTLLVGVALTLTAIGCVYAFDPDAPGGFLGFALGIMAYAATGLMGVFLCAFFTHRGSALGVVTAVVVAATIMLVPRLPALLPSNLVAPIAGWRLFEVTWFWFVPLAVAAAFATCCCFRPPIAHEPRGFEPV